MKVKVVQQEGEEEVGYEVIAQAIVALSDGMRKLSESRLRRETVLVLLANSTKLSKRDINLILNALERLEADYLKPGQRP